MAFGDLRGTLTGNSTSPGTGIAATGSVAVTKGDLILVNYGWRGTGDVTFTDNLGNGYQNLHTAIGAANAGIWAAWAYAKANGTLTTITAAHASSTGDVGFAAIVLVGPFDPWTLDIDTAPVADSATPYGCPASGTLSQASEVIVAFQAQGNGGLAASYTATSPYTLGIGASSGTGSNTASAAITFHLVSATTGETPSIGSSASTSGQGKTASFRGLRTPVLGDCIGILSGRGSISTNLPTYNGFATVAVGDVVAFVWCQATNSQVTSATDNLGNTYTNSPSGQVTFGSFSGIVFRSIVTIAGDLTTITPTYSAGAQTGVGTAAVFKGPSTALDTSGGVADTVTPFDCPATGILAQASELILGLTACSGVLNVATAPSILATSGLGSPTTVGGAISSRVVNSTASVAPQFTGSGGAMFTLSFKLPAVFAQACTAISAQSITTTSRLGKTFSPSIAELVLLTRSVRHAVLVSSAELVTKVAGKLVQKLIPTISSAESITTTRIKASPKPINVSQTQLVTLLFRVSHQIAFSVTSAQLLTLARKTSHLITTLVSSAQLVTMTELERYLRTIFVSSAELVTLVAQKQASQITQNINFQTVINSFGSTLRMLTQTLVSSSAPPQAVTLTRSASHLRTLLVSQAQAVTLLKTAAHAISVAISSSQNVSGIAAATLLRTLQGSSTAEVVTLTRLKASLRALTLFLAETVTLVAQKQTSQISQNITIASAQLVTLVKQIPRSITVAQAQLVMLTRVTSFLRTVLVSSVESVTLVRRAVHTLLASISSAEAVTLATTKAFLRTVLISSAEAVTLARVSAFVRTIPVSLGETVTLLRGAFHPRTVLVSIGEAVTLTRVSSYLRTILVSLGETMTLSKVAQHLQLLIISSAQLVSLATLKAFLRTISVVSAESVTLGRLSSRLQSLLVSIAENVTLTRSVMHLISIAQTQAVTLIKGMARVIIVAIGDLKTLATAKLTAGTKTVTIVQAEAVTLLRTISHQILIALSELVTRFAARPKTLTVSIAETVTRVLTRFKNTAISQAQTVTLTRRLFSTVSVVQAQLVTLRKGIQRSISIASSALVALATSPARLRTLTISIAETVTLVRLKAVIKAISVTQAQLVTLGRSTARTIQIVIDDAMTLTRVIRHQVLVSLASFVTLNATKASLRTIAVATGEQLTLVRSRLSTRLVLLSTGEVVTLTRRSVHVVTLLLSVAQNVRLARSVAKLVTLSTAETVSLGRAIATTVTLTAAELVALRASHTRQYAITLTTPLSLTLQAVKIAVAQVTVNISLSVGQVIRFLAQIIKSRPRSWHLRAWEPSVDLEATKTKPTLKAKNTENAL